MPSAAHPRGQPHLRRRSLTRVRWATVLAMYALWGANLARAGEPAAGAADTDTDTDTAAGGLTLHGHADSDAPLLHLEPMLSRPLAESLLATVERQDAELELGGQRARLFAEHWKDATTNARGVTAGFDLSHDFG